MKKIMFIGNGFDILHGINITFHHFVNSKTFQDGINSYKKYFIDDEYTKFSKETELWSRFEDYCKYIVENKNIQGFSFIKKICLLFQKWFEIQDLKKVIINKELKKFIKLNKIEIIVSFNYTNTTNIYGFDNFYFEPNSARNDYANINSWKDKTVMLHAYKSKEIQMVLGHDKNKLINKNKITKNWGIDRKFDPKKQVLQTILKSNEISEIIFLGFSFGDSDEEIVNFAKKIINKQRVVTIFYHNKINQSIRKHFKEIEFCKIKKTIF